MRNNILTLIITPLFLCHVNASGIEEDPKGASCAPTVVMDYFNDSDDDMEFVTNFKNPDQDTAVMGSGSNRGAKNDYSGRNYMFLLTTFTDTDQDRDDRSAVTNATPSSIYRAEEEDLREAITRSLYDVSQNRHQEDEEDEMLIAALEQSLQDSNLASPEQGSQVVSSSSIVTTKNKGKEIADKDYNNMWIKDSDIENMIYICSILHTEHEEFIRHLETKNYPEEKQVLQFWPSIKSLTSSALESNDNLKIAYKHVEQRKIEMENIAYNTCKKNNPNDKELIIKRYCDFYKVNEEKAQNIYNEMMGL